MRHIARCVRLAALVVGVAAPGASLAAQTLTPYDVFIFQNFSQSNSETNGRLAVGGNAVLSSWKVGTSLPANFSAYSLVVGGNLTTSGGSVGAGATYVGGTFHNGGTGFPSADPPQIGGISPVGFASEIARLTNISNGYAAMSATGSTLLQYSQLNFIGTSMFNVFDVSVSSLQAATGGYEFVTPFGATNIVNVTGTSGAAVLDNTGFLFDCTTTSNAGSCQSGSNDATPADAARLLWNFNGQTSLAFNGPVHGSILAPNADVTFGYGDVVGTVVARSASGTAEFYSNHDFSGPLPPTVTTPEPATLGLVAIGLLGVGAVAPRRRKQAGVTGAR